MTLFGYAFNRDNSSGLHDSFLSDHVLLAATCTNRTIASTASSNKWLFEWVRWPTIVSSHRVRLDSRISISVGTSEVSGCVLPTTYDHELGDGCSPWDVTKPCICSLGTSNESCK